MSTSPPVPRRRNGPPPRPAEEKRRLGNPGKRALPDRSRLVALPPVLEAPEPHRPLGQVGAQLWEAAWRLGGGWLARSDAETLLVVCEQLDERQALRVKVLRDGDRFDRAGLRALDAQVVAGLGLLGFNPVERSRLGVAEVASVTKLDALRRRRERDEGAG